MGVDRLHNYLWGRNVRQVETTTSRGRTRWVTVTCILAMVLTVLGVASPARAAYPSGCLKGSDWDPTSTVEDWCWIGSASPYDSASDYAVLAQRILRGTGYYGGSIDGQYGSVTSSAVQIYQTNHGLIVDGVVGGETWDALMNSTVGSSCGVINQSGYYTAGYRIAGEACGRYIQRNGLGWVLVRAYNSSGSSPTDNKFVQARTSGPMAL